MLMPPWAANSYDLTRIMREELESKYVRENIHKWIDLLFGVDQNNSAKLNLFYPLAYAEYHKDGCIERLLEDSVASTFLHQNMIQNMLNLYIAPSKLFTSSLEQIIKKSRRKMDSTSNQRVDRNAVGTMRVKEEATADESTITLGGHLQ